MTTELIKGIAWPVRFGAHGHFVRAEGVDKLVGNAKLLVLTQLRELEMEPSKGVVGYELLFRNLDRGSSNMIRALVTEAISKFEPRMRVRNVSMAESDGYAGYGVYATVEFEVVDTQETGTFTLRVDGD